MRARQVFVGRRSGWLKEHRRERDIAVGACSDEEVRTASTKSGRLGGLDGFREPHSDLRDESLSTWNAFDPDDRAVGSEVVGAKVHTDASGEIDALRAVHFPDVSIGGTKRDRPNTGFGGDDKSTQSVTLDARSLDLSMCGG